MLIVVVRQSIELSDEWGILGPLSLVVAHDAPIVESLDPLGWTMEPIANGDLDLGHCVGSQFEAFGCDVEHLFISCQSVVELTDVGLKFAHLEVVFGLVSMDSIDDALDDGEGTLSGPLVVTQYVEC
jgi:hypothetical protein